MNTASNDLNAILLALFVIQGIGFIFIPLYVKNLLKKQSRYIYNQFSVIENYLGQEVANKTGEPVEKLIKPEPNKSIFKRAYSYSPTKDKVRELEGKNVDMFNG